LLESSSWLADTTDLGRRWRAVLLFGSNTASYKFALGGALLELARSGQDEIKLEDLAVPFASRVCDHLKTEDRQAVNPGSTFLNACRDYNNESIELDELVSAVMNQGFRYVFDAFHRVDHEDVAPFFSLEGPGSNKKLILSPDLPGEAPDRIDLLDRELESRWKLVEAAWAARVPTALLDVEYSQDSQSLSVVRTSSGGRSGVGNAAYALSGYQGGRCFYCGVALDSEELDTRTNVDHVIPFQLAKYLVGQNIDHVWNLVDACFKCNSTKSARLPLFKFLDKLSQRNEYFIRSHHPLREALIRATGPTTKQRTDFITAVHSDASDLKPGLRWIPSS
jgi:5-methylcytosine-specific restriction endonuclease McrA